MTGRERLVQIYFGSHQVLRRYLTLFYGFTLGLALILAILAVTQRGDVTSSTATITQEGLLSQTVVPTLDSTQVHSMGKPTSLPTIPPTPNMKTPSTLGVTAADLQGVQVRLWHPWAGSTGAILQTILDEFNRSNQWGIIVQTSAYEGFGRLDEAMEAAIPSSTLPDMLIDYGYQAQHWDESEVVADLNPYVNDPLWGLISAEQADFYPGFWAEDLVKATSANLARRLGIPFYRSAYVLLYNQSWARELGYPAPPATPQDFKAQACAATQAITEQGDKSSLSKGGWLVTPQPGVLAGWIYAFGGEITNPGAPGYLFNTTETRQAFEFLKGMQVSGCLWSDAGLNPQTEFASRRTLFVVESLLDVPTQREAFTQAGNLDEWLVIPFPSGRQPVVDTYGPSLLVTRSTPARQLAAWLVVKWLVSPPNLAEWVKATNTLPTRQSVLSSLGEAASARPQWDEALGLLPDAHGEPSLPSWSVMRWALNDAMTELMNSQLSTDQIPTLLENLDNVAVEIYTQVR
jgi:multiple sugar transport system substrate-binding protein